MTIKEILNESLPCSGLYLIGSIYFNQNTNKPNYWVKVGQSKDLKRRINQYRTYNPNFHTIDFRQVDTEYLLSKEKFCHEKLLENCKWCTTGEWFIVEEEVYSELVNRGFNFFNFFF